MKKMMIGSTFALFLAVACGGCSSRDVNVTGETRSAEAISGPITIEFFEVPSDGGEEATSIRKVSFDKLGEFSEKIELEGDEVLIFALADADKNGACTEGELWAQVNADVKENKVEGVTLELTTAPCPKANSASK
jgi:hypothetical protein